MFHDVAALKRAMCLLLVGLLIDRIIVCDVCVLNHIIMTVTCVPYICVFVNKVTHKKK